MLTLQTYIPHALHQYVKSFWFLEVNPMHSGAGYYEEAILPDGHHEIIFHINNPAKRKPVDSGWITEPDIFVAAQTTTSYQLRLLPGAVLYGIRFYPHTLYPFLHIPCYYLNNRVPALGELQNATLFKNCIAPDPQQTFLNFEQLLIRLLSLRDVPLAGYHYVQFAVEEICKRKGIIMVDELIKQTGISGKYLDTLFEKYVGLGPKALSRIVQLNYFISYKTNGLEKSLTECAYEYGYYDQAHLIKSFRSFANTSPSAYFRNGRYINDYFTGL